MTPRFLSMAPRSSPLRLMTRLLAVALAIGAPVAAARAGTEPGLTTERSAKAPPMTDFVLIGNATGISDVDSSTLRAIFRGERSQWPSNRPVTIILPSSRAEFAEPLARMVFRSSPSGMQRFWLALVFQGRASPPVFLDSAEEMVAYVRRTPGAITLVPAGAGEASARDLVIRVK